MAENTDIRELKNEVKHLAEIVQESIRPHGNGALGINRAELRGMARRAGKNMRHLIDDTSKQAAEFRDSCEETISAHPLRSVGAAIAGGVLLGFLLNRGR